MSLLEGVFCLVTPCIFFRIAILLTYLFCLFNVLFCFSIFTMNVQQYVKNPLVGRTSSSQLDGHIAINLSIIRSKNCEIRSADGLGYERKAVEEYQLLIQ